VASRRSGAEAEQDQTPLLALRGSLSRALAAPSPSPRPLRSPPGPARLDSSGRRREKAADSHAPCFKPAAGGRAPFLERPCSAPGEGRHQLALVPGVRGLPARAGRGGSPPGSRRRKPDRTCPGRQQALKEAPGGEPPPQPRRGLQNRLGRGQRPWGQGVACSRADWPGPGDSASSNRSANSSAIELSPTGLADRRATAGAAGLA